MHYQEILIARIKELHLTRNTLRPVGRDGDMDVYFRTQEINAEIRGIQFALNNYRGEY